MGWQVTSKLNLSAVVLFLFFSACNSETYFSVQDPSPSVSTQKAPLPVSTPGPSSTPTPSDPTVNGNENGTGNSGNNGGTPTSPIYTPIGNANSTGALNGYVVDATTKLPLSAYVKILSGSVTYATVSTDSSGYYSVSLPASSYKLSFSKSGYVTYSPNTSYTVQASETLTADLAALSPNNLASNSQMRIVLTWTGPTSDWSENLKRVEDVDAYLKTPGSATPIYFRNTSGSGGYLDVDERNWRGPETITITQPVSGVYHYYIANYNNNCNYYALGKSKVRVAVYQGSTLIKDYSWQNGYGTVFSVFKFQIVNNQIQITDTQLYEPIQTSLFVEQYYGNCR